MLKTIIKKCLSLIVVIALFLSHIISVNAYTSRTQQEAVNWVNSNLGNSLDWDGAYGAQCVDLINYYYNYLGVTPVSGNAKDFKYNALPNGWQRIQYYNGFIPQQGDIAIMDISSYGHVSIITSADASGFNQIAQNETTHGNGGPCVSVRRNYDTLWGIIRPDFIVEQPFISVINSPTNVNISGMDGNVLLDGWAIDYSGIDHFIYSIDGSFIKNYVGNRRDDVAIHYPSYPVDNVGYYINIPYSEIRVGATYPETCTINLTATTKSGVEHQVASVNVTRTKAESNKPTITNAKITDIGPLGYTVTADVSDDSGISRVQFPSWTRANDQDDLEEWVTDSKYSGTVVDGKVTYHVKTSKHNFESGIYATHIYAYDIYGNEAVLVMDDQIIPSIESGAQNLGEDFYAEIENCDSSLVLSTLSSEKKELTTESSKNVVVMTNNNDEKQRWHFIRNSDGTYTIESCIEGYVLDVVSASNTSSTNIGIYESNNTNAQKWYVLKNGNGYSFMPQCAMTMLLDVESNSHVSGANVQTYDATYLNKAQVFNINEINLETTPAPTPELTPDPSPVATPEFTPNPTPSATPDAPNPTPTVSGENGLLGDVNFDTKIDAPDALLVLKHAAKIFEFDEKQTSVADVTGDEQIDAKDALDILKFAAKIIDEF